MNHEVTLYDTTLRDGSQAEGINFSASDKLRIAERIADFGMHYIEGGFPGSNSKDIEFFQQAARMNWGNCKIAAFGSTRKPGANVDEDDQMKALLDSEAPVITFVGKSSHFQVTDVLRTTLDENLKMLSDTTAFFKKHSREVLYDAEHFFDGYRENPEYTLSCLKAAADAGADYVVLCDTNGGRLPEEIREATEAAIEAVSCRVGIHTHNDSGVGVANALASIQAGASQVQGTVNGYGERTGNCNLTTVIPILELKTDHTVLPEGRLSQLSEVSRFVDEIANQNHDIRAPFVGQASFAHKGGMHANAVTKSSTSYEHIDPSLVGNFRRILVGEQSSRSNIMLKAKEMGVDIHNKSPEARRMLDRIKSLENDGYEFEAADATFELLLKRELEQYQAWFDLEEYHVSMRKNNVHGFTNCEATVKIRIDGEIIHNVSNGDGPVNALDNTLRLALQQKYPEIGEMRLSDYKVRIVNSSTGSASRIRVLIESSDGETDWGTVGVSDNVIDASWLALVDSVEYFLNIRHNGKG
ncbi:MAG: citramalate synthase [Verrucomicrobiota bacterium]